MGGGKEFLDRFLEVGGRGGASIVFTPENGGRNFFYQRIEGQRHFPVKELWDKKVERAIRNFGQSGMRGRDFF